MTVVTGAAGADLYHDPGPGLSRLRVSEDRGRVTARDNQQELRMRRVPGSGQVRSHEDRVPCIKCSSAQERVTEGQHQRCQNSCHHSHCLLCLLVSVLPHLHSIICGKGESLYRRKGTKTSLIQSGQGKNHCHDMHCLHCHCTLVSQRTQLCGCVKIKGQGPTGNGPTNSPLVLDFMRFTPL